MKVIHRAIEYTKSDDQIFEDLMKYNSLAKLSSCSKKKKVTLTKVQYSDQDLVHFDNLTRENYHTNSFLTDYNLSWLSSKENSLNIKVVEFGKQSHIDNSYVELTTEKMKIKYV